MALADRQEWRAVKVLWPDGRRRSSATGPAACAAPPRSWRQVRELDFDPRQIAFGDLLGDVAIEFVPPAPAGRPQNPLDVYDDLLDSLQWRGTIIKDDRVLAFGFDRLRGAGTYWLTNKVLIYISGVGKVNA